MLNKQALILLLLLVTGVVTATERLHLLVPGGAGGGWDTTARGIGEALTRSELVAVVSYENMSGGGGGRAIAHLIETADRQTHTLMISSTPIILRSLKKIFPQSWRDLTPIASVIVDYGAFVVKINSPYQSWQDVIDDFQLDPRAVNVAGGSSRGSMDHLVAALAFKQSGVDPSQVKYIPYNAGGHAMIGLLSGETQLLSTGLSEALILAEQGEIRILAMTAQKRLDNLPHIPTLVEQGVPAIFTNWRGLFAPPNTPLNRQLEYAQILEQMQQTSEWQKLRDVRGWTDAYIAGDAFVNFLAQQEQEMEKLMIELGLK